MLPFCRCAAYPSFVSGTPVVLRFSAIVAGDLCQNCVMTCAQWTAGAWAPFEGGSADGSVFVW